MEHTIETIYKERKKAKDAVKKCKPLLRQLANTTNLSAAMMLSAKIQSALKELYWIKDNMQYYSPCHFLSAKEAELAQTWWRTLRSIARAHNKLAKAMSKAKTNADCRNQFNESFLSRYVPRLIAL